MFQRSPRCTIVALAALMSAIAICVAQNQDPEQSTEVEVSFQNTTTDSVSLSLVDESGTENVIVEELAAGSEVSVNSLPGNTWIAKTGDEVIAEYEANENGNQTVDLALEESWRLPVQVVVQNNTGSAAAIALLTENGEEVELTSDLQPGAQFEQPDLAAGSLVRIKQNDEVVAEYVADNTPVQVLPLIELLKDYAREVTVTFQNTSDAPVDIFWLHPDGTTRLFLPELPADSQATQKCFPGHIWLIRQENDLVGTFVAGSNKQQSVDLLDLAYELSAASKALEAGEATLAVPSQTPDRTFTNSNSKQTSSGNSSTSGRNRLSPPRSDTNESSKGNETTPNNSNSGTTTNGQTKTNPTNGSTSNSGLANPKPPLLKFDMNKIVGKYQRKPVDNGFHDVVIEKVQGQDLVYQWSNADGLGWYLEARANNPLLKTDKENNPYFRDDGEIARDVRIEFVKDANGNLTDKIKGVTFRQEFYERVGDVRP